MKPLWSTKQLVPRIVMKFMIVLLLLWTLFPFYFLVVVPLQKPGSAAIGLELPSSVTPVHFKAVLFGRDNLWKYLINSCVASGGAMIAVLLISFPCAYAISRWKTKVSRGAYNFFFILRMFPPVALIIPYYFILARLNLIDTISALVIIYIPLTLPVGVWILKGFFDMIPVSIEEAAEIDGARQGQILVRIVLPVVAPGIGVSGAFTFLLCYIEYMYALTLTERKARTFSIYIAGFIGEHWVIVTEMVAATLIGMIPLVILYTYLQKYMRRGISFGVGG